MSTPPTLLVGYATPLPLPEQYGPDYRSNRVHSEVYVTLTSMLHPHLSHDRPVGERLAACHGQVVPRSPASPWAGPSTPVCSFYTGFCGQSKGSTGQRCYKSLDGLNSGLMSVFFVGLCL